MTVTYCDVTGKPIDNASTNYTWEHRDQRFDQILSKDLSPDGHEKLEQEIYGHFKSKKKFNFMEYKSVKRNALQKVAKT